MAKWQLDPAHTSVDFTVRHMMFTNVRGSFSDVEGTIDFDPENPAAASLTASVKTASVNTGAPDRDNHLRSADFFDVENHPEMTFQSTHVEITGDTTAKVTGDLTIRGITKSVVFDVEFLGHGPSLFGDERAGFEASFTINREDFGLTWNQTLESGGVLVSKEVKATLGVQAFKTVPETTA